MSTSFMSRLLIILAFLSQSALLVRADVLPTGPSPGDSFKQNSTCLVTWAGDTNSTTLELKAWKNMSIELMTGDNFAMVHLTTITSGQDGTTNGTFNYSCPDVFPNAAIYFYQFSAPGTNKQWTTRFTITSDSGESVDPTNSTQPDGKPIAWGTGTLRDPSTAIPAPVYSEIEAHPISSASILSSSSTPPTSASSGLSESAVPSSEAVTTSTLTPASTSTAPTRRRMRFERR